MTPVISFVGYANSGKTTLIRKIIRQMESKGYQIGILKHHHKDIPLEEGKDTTLFMEAGAKRAVLLGDNAYYVYEKKDNYLNEVVELAKRDVDLLIIEGFKHENFTKIEVQGDDKKRLGIPVIALVSNQEKEEGIPVFTHEEVEPLIGFLEEVIKEMKK